LAANGGAINSFGYDVSLRLVGGNADWPALCELDSDEDGFSNAEELGDPDCTWREGTPSPAVSPTAPGDPGSFPRPMPLDMTVEDMSPPVDFGPLPDAAPPVDMFIDIWDATFYDWNHQDTFMTTDEPWVNPDMAERDDLSLDMNVAPDGDSPSDAERDSTPQIEQDGAINIAGEESAAGSEVMSDGPKKQDSTNQSGCQHTYSAMSSPYPYARHPLLWFIVVLIGLRIQLNRYHRSH